MSINSGDYHGNSTDGDDGQFSYIPANPPQKQAMPHHPGRASGSGGSPKGHSAEGQLCPGQSSHTPRAMSPKGPEPQCPCLCTGADATSRMAGSERSGLMREIGQDPMAKMLQCCVRGAHSFCTRALTQCGPGPHPSLRRNQRHKTRQSSIDPVKENKKGLWGWSSGMGSQGQHDCLALLSHVPHWDSCSLPEVEAQGI